MYKKVLFIAIASMMLVGCKSNPVTSSVEPEPEYTVTEEFFNEYIEDYGFCKPDQNQTVLPTYQMGPDGERITGSCKMDNGKYDCLNDANEYHQIFDYKSQEDEKYVFDRYNYDYHSKEWRTSTRSYYIESFAFENFIFVGLGFDKVAYDEQDHSYKLIADRVTANGTVLKDVSFSFEDNHLIHYGFTIDDGDFEGMSVDATITDIGKTKVVLPNV